MEQIKDILFNQKTLDVLMEKQLIEGDLSIIPWGEGFALVDKLGKIVKYINIDANNQLIFQNTNFLRETTVSSVSPNQYHIYEQNGILGTLFTYPESNYSELDFFLESTSVDVTDALEVPDVLSQVLDIDVDMADSIIDMSDIWDLL